MKKQFIILTLICGWLVLKCTYLPEDIVLTEIDYDFSDIQLGFNEQEDTIRVYGNVELGLAIDFNERDLQSISVFLEEDELSGSLFYGSNGHYIKLNTNDYADGYYSLKLTFVVKSGSGSLADQLGTEFLTAELSKVLFIDNTPVAPLQIIRKRIIDGALEITWNKYNGYGFEYYSVGDCEHITNLNDTTALICNYAGGKIDLRLGLLAKQQYAESITEHEDYLNSKVTVNSDEVRIEWDPTPYYRDFTSYLYSYTDNTRSGSFESTNIHDINATTQILAMDGFPSSFTISLRLLNSYILDFQTVGDSFCKGVGSNSFLKNAVKISDDILLAKFQESGTSSSVIQFNLANGEKLNSLYGALDISNNGQELFQYVNGSINKLNPTDFSIEESYAISLNNQLGSEVRNLMALGNNKLLLYVGYEDNSHATFYMDFSSKSISRSNVFYALMFSHIVSDDGRFLYSANGAPEYGARIFDLELDEYADPDHNGSAIPNAVFIGSTNRLLMFDETMLYSTDLNGNNRIDLSINRNDFSKFRSIDGDNMLAYNETVGTDMLVFNTNGDFAPKVAAKFRYNTYYNTLDNLLLAYTRDRLFLRDIE